ncbi:MAG: PIN domain nuclease [Planctomycetota bacterium]|nr:MAG: PIN domain nuclease [Planctomycetota bacterium]
MAYLLDTGVLLRLVNMDDPAHSIVETAVQLLIDRGEKLTTSVQNIAEFYNVATRPAASNGFGLAPTEELLAVRTAISPICWILHLNRRMFGALQRLLETYSVQGKQGHDARLTATMLTWRVSHILTLNERHFVRFVPEGIVPTTPYAIASGGAPSEQLPE